LIDAFLIISANKNVLAGKRFRRGEFDPIVFVERRVARRDGWCRSIVRWSNA
jgi:hypothetical protein